VVPIPGTTKIKHLDDNMAAGKVHLNESELATVAAAVPHEEVAGARYSGLATFVDQMEPK
jgi:aryl-alcohol dehydrogenase-like predicted oxidoreductase